MDDSISRQAANTNMKKYRKKPIVIEAYKTDVALDIETLEGIMHASVGDYIITGVNGEQYPCKPDIFKKTYEEISSAQPEQDVLAWLLAYHTKSFELHGRYFPHEVISWLVNDFSKEFIAERREE